VAGPGTVFAEGIVLPSFGPGGAKTLAAPSWLQVATGRDHRSEAGMDRADGGETRALDEFATLSTNVLGRTVEVKGCRRFSSEVEGDD